MMRILYMAHCHANKIPFKHQEIDYIELTELDEGYAVMTSQKTIPFFNYTAMFADNRADFMRVIEDVCQRGAYIMQRDLHDFESQLAGFLNVKYAFGVANGTDALIIALHAAGIHPGDEVILPSHTYIASAASIHFVGAKPVLVECGSDHMVD